MPALKRPEERVRLALPARQGLLAGETDVVVVGGGPAGLGAAIAAADAGARVVLVERYGFFGGNATAALVMPLMSFFTDKGSRKESASTSLLPSDHGPGEAVVHGVLRRLLERLVAAGGAVAPSLATGFVVPFDPEWFKLIALELVDEAGVEFLFHAFASGVLPGNEGVVLEGSVEVNQPGREVLLSPGQQAASNPGLATTVAQAISWSPDAESYVQLLRSFVKIERELANLPAELRTNSDLLPYLPPQAVVYVQQTKTNGFAIASMILGIVWIYWIGSILALVFGYVAKGQIERSAGRQGGKGMAIAGIVLGWIGVGILALVIVFAIAFSDEIDDFDDINSDPPDGFCDEDRFVQDPDC